MKKFIGLLFILVIFSSLYWIMSREDVETTKKDEIKIPTKEEVGQVKNLSVKKAYAPVIRQNKTSNIKTFVNKLHPAEKNIKKLKEDKIIQAKIVDGKAIAFGDVVLGLVDENETGNAKYANFEAQSIKFWDTNRIYYQIDKNLKNKVQVEAAIKILNETTVLEFTKFTSQDQDGIFFKEGKKNCYSLLGKQEGAQPIWLAPECGVTEILHEVLHSLGFIHEQSRSDRDIYITVKWNNILPDYYGQYQMVPDDYMTTVEGTEFDFNSIMIYKPNFFAKNEKLPTMVPNNEDEINPSVGALSPVDIERIYRIYGQ